MPIPADEGLAPEQFPELNRQFYDGLNPGDYFDHRITSLALTSSRQDLVRQGLREKLELGVLALGGPAPSGEYDVEDEELTGYLLVESLLILHHAGEVLFRLFFAHEHQPPCPWLEAARVRGPGAFPRLLESFVKEAESEDQINRVSLCFLGRPAEKARADSVGVADGESPSDALEATCGLLIMTAHLLLDDARLYNAAKHGLAVLPAERGMSLDHEAMGIPWPLRVHGNSLRYLETRAKDSPNERARWVETTSWVRPDHYLGWAVMLVRLLRSIWAVGSAAYVDRVPFELAPVLPRMLEAIEKASTQDGAESDDGIRSIVTSLSMELLYFVDGVEPRRSADSR